MDPKSSVGWEDRELALAIAARMSAVLRIFAGETFLFEDALAEYRAAPAAPPLPSPRALAFFKHLAELGILEEVPTQVVYPGGEVKELVRWNIRDEQAVANLEVVVRERLVG